ncbi:hypothetical protein ACFLRA_04005 [Bdellovibrionota bacterium]
MKRLIVIVIGLTLLSCASSSPKRDLFSKRAPIKEDKVIARVNQEPITYGEYWDAFEQQQGRRPMSEEEFLDQYINFKLGAQKAAAFHLERHPAVQYEVDKFIFNRYLDEKYRTSYSRLPKKEYRERVMTKLKNQANVWISPEYLSGQFRKLPGDSLVARINNNSITAENLRRLYKKYSNRGYHHREFLEDIIYFKVVVDTAKKEGWGENRESASSGKRPFLEP